MRKVIIITILFSLIFPGCANANEKTELENYLIDLKLTGWIESYEYGVFDCSNMSSLLTVKLKDYETRIEEGYLTKGLINSNGTVSFGRVLHAVVRVKLDEQWYYIETTNLTLHENYNRFKVERVYKDYKEAISFRGEREYGIGELK